LNHAVGSLSLAAVYFKSRDAHTEPLGGAEMELRVEAVRRSALAGI
jgi:hypothetical protein